MLTRAMLLWLGVCGAVVAFLYSQMFLLSSEKQQQIQLFLQEPTNTHKIKPFDRPLLQVRNGIQKDFWTFNGQEHLLTTLNSHNSLFKLYRKDNRLRAKEHLFQIHGWMQEKIDYATNIQFVKEFKTKEGTYYFPSHEFITNLVDLWCYEVPIQQHFPLSCSNPYLKATAYRVKLSALQQEPLFAAKHLTIHLEKVK